jgi:putative flippase GtrA
MAHLRQLYVRNKQKVNYLLVGAWNTIFGYGSFALLYLLFSHAVHYLVLFIISYLVSITNSYIGFKLFVFRTKGNYLHEYLRFYLIYGTIMLLNLGLLPLSVALFNVSPLVAQAGFILFSTAGSYLGHKYFSFGVKLEK